MKIKKILISNRKAYFEYNILDTYIAGIELVGSEVKSIKSSKASIVEAYCFIKDDELYIKGMHVTEHKEGGKHNNHQPVRDRKLLMKKKEIIRLRENTSEKGLTIMPLSIILSDTGLIKLEIGVAKGKKLYDKKVASRIKTLDKEMKDSINL